MTDKLITFTKHDTNGHLMTLGEFIDACHTGQFLDCDGHGYYANKDYQSDLKIHPSEVMRNEAKTNYSHVKWYNK